jgi:hypothetical protein
MDQGNGGSMETRWLEVCGSLNSPEGCFVRSVWQTVEILLLGFCASFVRNVQKEDGHKIRR